MSTTHLQVSLLRPAILHILRASGFHAARPAAADTLVDIAARYLMLLAQRTAGYAWSNNHDTIPTITDVRMALQEVGALYPGMGPLEEQLNYDDDLRGVENFAAWVEGDVNKEIRRIAGLHHTAGEVVDMESGTEREDFLSGESVASPVGVRYSCLLSSKEEAQQDWRGIQISGHRTGEASRGKAIQD